MTRLGDAIAARKIVCPRCDAQPGVSCREPGRQYVTLDDTHDDRLLVVNPNYTSEVEDATG